MFDDVVLVFANLTIGTDKLFVARVTQLVRSFDA